MLVGVLLGLAYFAGTLYWIANVMVTYGGLTRPVAVLLNGLLVGFLALFPGVAFLGIGAAIRAAGAYGLVAAPAFWVASELAREHLFGGFPWVLLGYSQISWLRIAQFASVCGVYGVSGLVAFVSMAAVGGVVLRGRLRMMVIAVAAGWVATVALWGAARLQSGRWLTEGDPVAVAVVQGNIAQEDKWEPGQRQRILTAYLEMTREVAARGARLVIWPESATPFNFEDDGLGRAAIESLVREKRIHLLFGSDQVDRRGEFHYYNAAFLLGPDGATAGVYRKIHLVPFGEYVPFKRVLFFASPLVEAVSDFSPGDKASTLPVDGHAASVAICYEVVYPSLIRRSIEAGSGLLTTITNDAWYGRTSAPLQHFDQAAMRAIEQGRYLARAANTGVSGFVDPYGRVIARSGIFEEVGLVQEARFLNGRTVYTSIGDVIAYVAIALTAAALITVRPSR
jgi:apolipoprotein N-acyltransferase